jgi:hypothetical protein
MEQGRCIGRFGSLYRRVVQLVLGQNGELSLVMDDVWVVIGNSRVHASLVWIDWKARFSRCASWADANIGLTVLIGAEEVLVVVDGVVDP